MCQGRMPQSVRERYLKMKEAPAHPANLDVLIQNFDCALKAFFELDEQNWKVGIDQISLRYQKALQKEKILL